MLVTLRSQRVKVLDILLGANFSHRQVCFDTHVRLIAVLLCEGIPHVSHIDVASKKSPSIPFGPN